jgi:hypothetical protein
MISRQKGFKEGYFLALECTFYGQKGWFKHFSI